MCLPSSTPPRLQIHPFVFAFSFLFRRFNELPMKKRLFCFHVFFVFVLNASGEDSWRRNFTAREVSFIAPARALHCLFKIQWLGPSVKPFCDKDPKIYFTRKAVKRKAFLWVQLSLFPLLNFFPLVLSKSDVTVITQKAAGKLDSLLYYFLTLAKFETFSPSLKISFSLFLSFHSINIPPCLHTHIPARSSASTTIYSNLVSQNNSNDYKGAVYQNETSISSPARRSEVSPIQNHVSNQKKTLTDKSEVKPSVASWQVMSSSEVLFAHNSPQKASKKRKSALFGESQINYGVVCRVIAMIRRENFLWCIPSW